MGATSLLRQRDYLLGLAGNIASATAENIVFLAMLARVYEQTRSAANVGLTGILEALPAIALAPFIGVMLDRVDRRHVMVAADAFNVGAALLLAQADGLGVIYACAFLLAVGGAVFAPANQAMQPALLPRELYVLGASVRVTAQSVRQIAGPALGGMLVGVWGFRAAVMVAASLYALSGVATAMIRTSGRVRRDESAGAASFWDEAFAGWRAIRASAPVTFVATFQALVAFTMAMQAPLVYVFVREVLGRGPEMTGTLFSAAGVGGIAGGLAMARWGERVTDRLGLAMTTLAFDGVVLMAFTFSTSPPVSVVLFMMFGLIGAVNGVVYSTILQEEVADAVRGRVQTALVVTYRTVDVLSVAIGTLAADRWGVVPVFAACALAEIAVAVAARQLPSYQAALRPVDAAPTVA
jgi:MFS family permease